MDENLMLLIGAGALAFWAWSSKAKVPATVETTGATGATNVITGLDASKPRGIRNNNPGNIKYSPANKWLGQRGQDSGGFVVFDTPTNGIRAMAKLIKTYYNKHGLDTLLKITRRWAPDPIGLSGAYAATVSRLSGHDVNAHLTMTGGTLAGIIPGFIAQENGVAYATYYPADILAAGINAS